MVRTKSLVFPYPDYLFLETVVTVGKGHCPFSKTKRVLTIALLFFRTVVPGKLSRDQKDTLSAFTMYDEFTLRATRDIPAGSELFVNPQERRSPSSVVHATRSFLPPVETYQRVDAILSQLDSFALNLTTAEWTGT